MENTVSLVVGRGGDGAGRLLAYFSLGCWCGARRAEAQMDGALTKKKRLHKEVEVGETRRELAISFFQPAQAVNIDNRGLANCVRAYVNDHGGLRLHTDSRLPDTSAAKSNEFPLRSISKFISGYCHALTT